MKYLRKSPPAIIAGIAILFFCKTLSAEVVATVNGESITLDDLKRYGRASGALVTYLNAPGGPMQILDVMLQERLLQLEGQRLDIKAKGNAADSPQAYARLVYDALIKPCPEPDDKTLRAFYDANPAMFSTPLFLRLQRFGLRSDENNRTDNTLRLEQIKQQISAAQITFDDAAEQYNEDEESRERNGDIGFIPIKSPAAPFWKQFSDSDINTVIGPLQEKEMVFLYRVTERRDPLLEPYDSAQKRAAKAQQAACNNTAADRVFSDLAKRWSVEIKVTDISVFPE